MNTPIGFLPLLLLGGALAGGVLCGQQQQPAGAGRMKMDREIPYAEPRNERQLLDVYGPVAPAGGGAKLPVVVWVHGGGWMAGSKNGVGVKPAAFVDRGFVFVAMNYRFVSSATMGDIVRDVAKATGWVHANIARYNGDPQRLLLMGHSAGAQLAALLCTDERYLKAEKVPLAHVRACVPVDGDTYDVPLRVAAAVARRKAAGQPAPKMGHPEKFGNLQQQREYSAVNHVGAGRGIPPFLILHVAEDIDTSTQAYRLWAALDMAGVPARIFGAESTDHVKLDANLGVTGDAASAALFGFLAEVVRMGPRF